MIDLGQARTVQDRRDSAKRGPWKTSLRERIAAYVAEQEANTN